MEMNENTFRDAERLDKSSASSFEIDVFCPGRQNLIRTLPPEAFKETENEEAERGTRLHKAWETGMFSDLDAEDLEIYENGNRNGERIVADWCQAHNITQFKEGPRELRLWLHDRKTMVPILSGKLDKHYVSTDPPGYVLIDERKSLWCSNLTPSERNWQGRVQAVLIAQEYGATHVRVAFNKAMFGKSDVVDYTAEDLAQAESSIYHHEWETRQPGAQRRPGPHCRYCAAKPFCREAAAMALLPSVSTLAVPVIDNASKEGIEKLVSLMTLEDMAAVQRRATIIDNILKAIKARMKGFSVDELAVVGFGFAKSRELRSITKTKECFVELKEIGLSEETLFGSMEFSNSKLTEALQSYSGCSKKKAEEDFKRYVAIFGVTTQSDPSLKEL